MKFVWLDVRGGGQVPVNPDLVAYLRSSGHDEGATEVVFGAVQGGLHSVTVVGDGYEVARRLEGVPSREDVSRGSGVVIDAYLQGMAADAREKAGALDRLTAEDWAKMSAARAAFLDKMIKRFPDEEASPGPPPDPATGQPEEERPPVKAAARSKTGAAP